MGRMPTPVEMGSVTDRTFTIVWSDDHRSTYTWRNLRAGCPCARCQGEGNYRPAPPRGGGDPAPGAAGGRVFPCRAAGDAARAGRRVRLALRLDRRPRHRYLSVPAA